MTAKTIYYLITVLELYIFSVGACIYIMRYETLSPKAAKLYKININDNIPMYMNKICKEYNLVCVKISPLKTAMIGDEFAIMIAIDRFDIEIYYLYKKDPDMGKYPCGSFFAQAYDSQDREDLLSGEGADIYIYQKLSADEKEVFDDGWVLDTKSLP